MESRRESDRQRIRVGAVEAYARVVSAQPPVHVPVVTHGISCVGHHFEVSAQRTCSLDLERRLPERPFHLPRRTPTSPCERAARALDDLQLSDSHEAG